MARPSSRIRALDAAATIVGRDGLRALTYESLAAETGLTKGGLLYHFPSRDALVVAMHDHLAARWDADIASFVDGDPAEADAEARLAAYVRSTASTPTRAELLLLLESVDVPGLVGAWNRVIEDWAPPVPAEVDPDGEPSGDAGGDGADGAAELDAFVARLAADGLWVFEALTGNALPAAVRERAVERIIALGTGRPAG
ncbi:TetR/AcrR family transcriptional regulator [Georgenia sp. Z1344]|uniref:TetR/AcrR family transcriptional regulator n=1 Tax=Georgenia sp. Z1344 TaxID=3416706 RepID=UPI003CF93010